MSDFSSRSSRRRQTQSTRHLQTPQNLDHRTLHRHHRISLHVVFLSPCGVSVFLFGSKLIVRKIESELYQNLGPFPSFSVLASDAQSSLGKRNFLAE